MAAPTKVTPAADRLFFAWLSLAILCTALAGFAQTYLFTPLIGRPAGTLPPTPLVHLHAALSFAWCLLLLAQAMLVVAGRVPQHRRLGLLGFGLYLALVATGPLVAVRAVVRAGSPEEELAFLAVSLGNVLAYTTILGAAFHWRSRPAIHKRLLMLGMVVLLTAPFGRLIDLPYQLPHVLGPGLVVLALAVWDRRSLGAIHPLTRRLGGAVLAWELAPNLYMESAWWLSFARWLTGMAA